MINKSQWQQTTGKMSGTEITNQQNTREKPLKILVKYLLSIQLAKDQRIRPWMNNTCNFYNQIMLWRAQLSQNRKWQQLFKILLCLIDLIDKQISYSFITSQIILLKDQSIRQIKKIMNQSQSNQDCKKLLHFDRIIWIDDSPDQNIFQEKAIFKLRYGCQLQHCKSVENAKLFMEKRKGKKFLIVCSSKLLSQVIKSFENNQDCYEKYIIFCGSASTCERFIGQPQVYKAYYDQWELIIGIQLLQKWMNETPRIIWLIQDSKERKEIYRQKQIKSFMNKMENIQMEVQFFQLGKLQNEIKKMDNSGFKTRIILDNRDGNWTFQYQYLISKLAELKNLESIYEIVNKKESDQILTERQSRKFGRIHYNLVSVEELREVPTSIEVQYKISILKL